MEGDAMTEEEWQGGTNPAVMLDFLRGKVSPRKLRLFAAFCRREYLRFRIAERGGRTAKWADITEAYADGEATFEEWDSARQRVHGTFHSRDAFMHAWHEIECAATAAGWSNSQSSFNNYLAERELQLISAQLRDIFGNPFRPVAFDAAWRTSTAVGLAEAIYADRAFDRLPILADAIQDAGCEDADILGHCRGSQVSGLVSGASRSPDGPHVRGCWVVDLVLGKV